MTKFFDFSKDAPISTGTHGLDGRAFVLGLPNRQGIYQIFLNGSLWRVAPGQYSAGDRVQVVAVEQDQLVVQRL